MIQELVFSLVLFILKIDASPNVLNIREGSENSSSVYAHVWSKSQEVSSEINSRLAISTVFISFSNVSVDVHYAFLACLHAILYCEATCRSKVCFMCDWCTFKKCMKWISDDHSHFPFLFQVVMDSVSIVDAVGDWPPEVVQEESNK